MDSTNPQAPQQQQQQQPPPPPTQLSTQPQQQAPPTQPQQQRPQPIHPQQQQPNQQQHHQPGVPPVATPFPPLSSYQPPPRQPYIHQPMHYPPAAAPYYYPQYMPAPQTAWVPTPATPYTAQPAQQTMVTTQPQSNVPQQHNKSSHVVGQSLMSDRRPQNSNLQTVTVPSPQASTITNVKKRAPATLKDPKTGLVVPLSNDNNSTATKNSTQATKPSQNVEHVTTLLQKVSEEVKEENKENAVNINIKTEKTNLNTPQKEQQPKNPKQQTPPPVQQAKQQQQSPQNQQQQTQQENDNAKIEEVAKVEHNDKQKQPETPKQVNNVSPKVEKVKQVEPTEESVVEEQKEKVVEEKAEEKQIDQPIEPNSITDTTTSTTTDGEAQKDAAEEESNPLASLIYEPWQYNPISNRQGKRIYSKQFLLDVCEKIVKIDPLQKESEEQTGYENNRLAFDDKFDMFAPKYNSNNQRGGYNTTNRQNDPSRRQSQQNYTGRGSAGQEKPRKVITSVSLTQEVELKTTNNPWRPTKEIKEDLPTDEVETESLKKRFRSILNKLTPNNFDNLAHSVTELNIDTESKLGEVIDIVFAKALAEPGYCVLYGQMCSHLKKISAGTANFGNTLLKRCQHQFQSDIYAGINIKERKEKIEAEQDPEVKKQLQEELYEDMYRCRMRGLGLIKFIGELYKIEMLNDKIMIDCVVRLLLDTSEESLECLCDLLATVGEKLDRSTSQKNNEKEKKAAKATPKPSAYGAGGKSMAAVLASGTSQQQPKGAEQPVWNLDTIFDELHKIRKNKELDLPVRIRFKLLDTCDLREKDNWQSKKTRDNNPKKIDEIREAHKEKLEQERKQNAMGPRKSQEGRRLGQSGGSSGQLSSMDTGGGYRGQSNLHTSSSHLIRDHSMSDSMKSNHDDIESQKEHQKRLEGIKGLSFMKKQPTPINSVSLKPNSRFYQTNANKQS